MFVISIFQRYSLLVYFWRKDFVITDSKTLNYITDSKALYYNYQGY